MPYTLTPRWAAWVLYGMRGGLYLVLLGMGAGAVWWTPMTIDARMPPVVTVAWGVLAIIGALGCLGGSLTRRYRYELVGLPLLIGAVVVYGLTVWGMVPTAHTRLAQACAITAVGIALTVRWVDLLVVRWRLRRAHDARCEG